MDILDWLTDAVVIAAAVGVLMLLWRPGISNSRNWRATVTPLASIIGSGFLVVAPLLDHTVGNWAIWAMLGIVSLAYAVGGAVRYNIRHVEKIVDDRATDGWVDDSLKWLERLSKLALALAYVIAITFYLELLAAFVLRPFGVLTDVWQKAIATALVAFIGIVGYTRGLSRLEVLEKYSVDGKLAIIAGLLIGLVLVNGQQLLNGTWAPAGLDVEWNVDTLRQLLGAFLIVQGFETSRYMGNVYDAEERVRTMRYAQLLSSGIYVVFIGLATVLFADFGAISETGIIALSEQVATALPALLIIGAAMAQFSAAVADTLASGGLVESATHGAVSHRQVYLAVMLLAAIVLWSSHIFAIIAYASRAFALYYAIQCAMAALRSALAPKPERSHRRAVLFSVLALAMLFTTIFGIPAETVSR